MSSDETLPLEDESGPDWKERLGAAQRAAKALFATRAAIFREELAQKGAHVGKAALWLSLAVAFALLALLLLGGPIAGLTGAFFLYLLVAGAVGLLGMRAIGRVRPFDFPVTRDEVAKDLEAIRKEPEIADEGPASPEALAAERASIAGEEDELEEDVVEERVIEDSDLEQRFRAGSE